jgi:hypothetical protein
MSLESTLGTYYDPHTDNGMPTDMGVPVAVVCIPTRLDPHQAAAATATTCISIPIYLYQYKKGERAVIQTI